MSDLPPDVLEEILSRVPASTLSGLRFTCKTWNAILKDQRFTEKNFRQAAKLSFLLMLKQFRVCSVNACLNLDVSPPSIELKGVLSLKDPHSNPPQADILEVFHCDGLLLCTTKDYTLVVWNPCSGDTRWIQPKTCPESSSTFTLGYQSNKSSRNYKILRYWRRDILNSLVYRVEIYDLSSYSWRVLEDVDLNCRIPGNGVSMKGNTYCLPLELDGTDFLLSFDFTKERFRRVCGPKGLRNVVLSTVREEKLSLLDQKLCETKLKMDIWVATNIDTKDVLLWTKSFSLDVDIHDYHFYRFESFLIDEEKKLVLSCYADFRSNSNIVYVVGEDDVCCTKMPFVRTEYITWQHLFMFDYVPSLVQV